MPSLRASPVRRTPGSKSSTASSSPQKSRSSTISDSVARPSKNSGRLARAAFMIVKSSTEEPLESLEELTIALQQAGLNPTKRFLKQRWPPDKGTVKILVYNPSKWLVYNLPQSRMLRVV